MKNFFAIAVLLGAACLISGAHISAQPLPAPPVPVQAVCNVNGVAYPVDFSSQIWGHDAYYNWAVIGNIIATPQGYVAVRNDGVTFPAACGF